MGVLRGFARFIVGFTFIFSGFVKIIDPAGTGLIVAEYLRLAGMVDVFLLAKIAGAILSVAELVMGIYILLGIKMTVSSKVALAFISIFTLLTFYLALFNPIQDCGCFGEALKLSNWQTFWKNLFLLALVLIIYYQRNSFIPIAPVTWEYSFALLFLLFALFISVYSFRHLPMIDFTEYRTGRNMRELTGVRTHRSEPEFETILIYRKGESIKEFAIDSLPDSTWTFVDSKTKIVGGNSLPSNNLLSISDSQGNYVTDSLLFSGKRLFITTIPRITKSVRSKLQKSVKLREELLFRGYYHIYLTGASPQEADSLMADLQVADSSVYFADYKVVITMNRSLAGTIYISDGIISAKWSRLDTPLGRLDEILSEDPDSLSARLRMKSRITTEFTILGLIALIMIIRYLCRVIYKHKFKEENVN